jgi:mRNA-decapping enzyme subunit 2
MNRFAFDYSSVNSFVPSVDQPAAPSYSSPPASVASQPPYHPIAPIPLSYPPLSYPPSSSYFVPHHSYVTTSPPSASPSPAIFSAAALTPLPLTLSSSPPAYPSSAASSATSSSTSSSSSAPLPDLSSVFEDLYSRFFINLPPSELASFERILIQLEQAWWFYCDFYSDPFPALPKFNLKNFCSQFFQFSGLLSKHLKKFDTVFNAFQSYLASVPVCGVILLAADYSQCLMVKSFKGNSWGFPKGKIDESETEKDCAIRECNEEVGFDCSEIIDETEFIEGNSRGKNIKLFIIQNVPLDTNFQTQTRKEIASIEWIRLDFINKSLNGEALEQKKNSFWNVRPFLEPLKRWIKRFQQGKIGYGRGNKGKNYQTQGNQSNKQNKKSGKTNPPSSGKRAINNATNQSKGSTAQPIDSLTFGSSAPGWSPEQMFELNERKFGVKSSVPQENLEIPENIEEILEKVLGKKGNKGGSQGQNGQEKQRNNQNNNANGNSKEKEKLRNKKGEAGNKSLPVEELDFCHDPHRSAQRNKASGNEIQSSAIPATTAVTNSNSTPANSTAPSSFSDGVAFNFAAFAAAVQKTS